MPVFTILVATRALSRGREHRRRLSALFDAAAEAQVVESAAELETVLRDNARAAVASRFADLRQEGPLPKEIGARVRAGEQTMWLVAPAVNRARASVEGDRKALEALATVGEEAFARLSLTDEMGRLARHDALTSLPNRTLFLDRVEQGVIRARRNDTTLAVLFLDLDGFKGVNDRFGHAEGDELLKIVAARLVACVRAVDSVARLGGDEFAVLLEGVDGVGELDILCQRLLVALRREIHVMGHEVVVGASIGVAVADRTDDAPGLLRNADMAMYRAKALGKDRFFVYQPSLREENVRRLELIEALRRGISTEDCVVHYQPIIDLARGRVAGVEALVRWQRPDGLVRAGLVHRGGRGERPDLRARRAGAGPDGRGRAVAGPGRRAAADDGLQHVRAPAAGPRLPGPRRAGGDGPGREPAAAGDDRDGRRGRRRRDRLRAAHAARAGRRPGDRRLRGRLLLDRLPAAPAGRDPQDRPRASPGTSTAAPGPLRWSRRSW